MHVRAYLRASTKEQDADRARADLEAFCAERGLVIAATYTENESGASLHRPELFRLLGDCRPGDVLLVEQVDRLSRLNDADWEKLKREIKDREVKVVALDLPTSHMCPQVGGRVHRPDVRGGQRHDARHAGRHCPQGLRGPPPKAGPGDRQGEGRRAHEGAP